MCYFFRNLGCVLIANQFTAPDLSDIAKNLDALERASRYDEAHEGSTNMDDTGKLLAP